MISDAELDYWGEYFLAHGLRQQGILFESFIAAPEEIIAGLERRASAHTGTVVQLGQAPRVPAYRRRPALHRPHG